MRGNARNLREQENYVKVCIENIYDTKEVDNEITSGRKSILIYYTYININILY